MADTAIGADGAVIANDHTVTDHGIGADAAAHADPHILAHHRAASDLGVIADAGAGGDEGARMDEGLGLRAGIEKLSDAREGEAGIVGQKQRAAIVRIAAELAAGHHDAGMTGGEGGGVPRIAEHGKFAGDRIGQLGHVVNHFIHAFGMGKLGAHNLGNMTQRKRPFRKEEAAIRHACPNTVSLKATLAHN